MKEHWKARWRKLGWLASGIYLASLVLPHHQQDGVAESGLVRRRWIMEAMGVMGIIGFVFGLAALAKV